MTPIEAKSPRVALLIADGPLGKCVANRLSERFPELTVIQEEPEGKWDVVRRRARHCGWSAALGQAAFGLVYKLGNRKHEHRRQKILSGSGLSPTLRPDLDVHRVPSINADGCEALLKNLKPDVVAVYGTRLIKPRLLQSFSVPFLNYHAGITPTYRGQHPAYWALVNDDAENAGVTIHTIDAGVDTGLMMCQERVKFSKTDNIWTYQWVQLCVALPLLEKSITRALAGQTQTIATAARSQLHFPPTLWTYIWNGLIKRVW